MGARINYVGRVYVKLTVVDQWRQREKSQVVTMVKAVCECGMTLAAKVNNLQTGHTTSCGCVGSESRHRVRNYNDLSQLDFNEDLTKELSGIIGAQFDRLKILAVSVKPGRQRRPYARCQCECGNVKVVRLDNLKNGSIQSCGCYLKERQREANTTHGKCHTIKYKARQSMLSRVNNTSSPAYRKILERGGVLIDPRWVKSFTNFDNDLPEPFKGAHLDRIDNNKGYFKENVRWATPSQNQQNSSQSKVWIVFGEEFQSASEAAKFHGIGVTTVKYWCNGYVKRGNRIPPKPGCRSQLKYKKAS